jgi:hypothetical protein
MSLELLISRDGNHVIGNYYRISAYRGNTWLGERIYAGYTRRESERMARAMIRERGSLNR